MPWDVPTPTRMGVGSPSPRAGTVERKGEGIPVVAGEVDWGIAAPGLPDDSLRLSLCSSSLKSFLETL